MAFRSFGGTRHIEQALEVLERLAADDRRFVWRAAASALHYLGRRRPEVVRPIVESWLLDERRVRAAKTALRYMPGRPSQKGQAQALAHGEPKGQAGEVQVV
jgi:hypothetical protein